MLKFGDQELITYCNFEKSLYKGLDEGKMTTFKEFEVKWRRTPLPSITDVVKLLLE